MEYVLELGLGFNLYQPAMLKPLLQSFLRTDSLTRELI